MGDFKDCIENMEENPIYCVLNMIRVFRYLKEGIFSSIKEAANWGLSTFPNEYHCTIQKVLNSYINGKVTCDFEKMNFLKLENILPVRFKSY